MTPLTNINFISCYSLIPYPFYSTEGWGGTECPPPEGRRRVPASGPSHFRWSGEAASSGRGHFAGTQEGPCSPRWEWAGAQN